MLSFLLTILVCSFAIAGEGAASDGVAAATSDSDAVVPETAPVVPVPAVVDEDDDFFSKTTTEEKGANAGVPSSDSFHDDEEIEIAAAPPPKPKADAGERDLSGFDGKLTTISNSKLPVETNGATVLGDNWGPTVAFTAETAVVIDMPVLYAKSKAEFDGVAYWLVAEAYADGKKVAEARVNVTRDSIAETGASVQFFRVYVPVAAKTGMIEMKVGKASAGAAKADPLFTRSVKYTIG